MPSLNNPLAKSYYDSLYSYSEEEFGLLFQRQKKSETSYLWRFKRNVIRDCDKFYFQLPNLPQAIDKIGKLVIGNGIDAVDSKGNSIERKKNTEFLEFLSTFPDGDISFLQEILRLYIAKGNGAINLVENLEKELTFDIYTPDRYGIESASQNATTAKSTILNYWYLPRNGEPQLLTPATLIVLKANPSGVFGVPPILFNTNLSNAIIADFRKFGMAKNNGAYKKQFIAPLKIGVKGGIETVEVMSDDDLTQFRSDINKSLNDANQSIQVGNVKFTSSELTPVEGDENFITLAGETYPMHISALTGIAPYMIMAKEPNRSVTEQQYKEMIEMKIQPLNNYFTKIIRRMYEIWCVAKGKTPTLQLTLKNPKPFLDAIIDGKTLLTAAQLNLISQDEFRNYIGLEAATEEQKAAFQAKNATVPAPPINQTDQAIN